MIRSRRAQYLAARKAEDRGTRRRIKNIVRSYPFAQLPQRKALLDELYEIAGCAVDRYAR